jgi:hypothetical protein
MIKIILFILKYNKKIKKIIGIKTPPTLSYLKIKSTFTLQNSDDQTEGRSFGRLRAEHHQRERQRHHRQRPLRQDQQISARNRQNYRRSG